MADLILSPAISDAATVTGAATSGDLTIANMQNMRPRRTTRFASLTGMYSEWDLGSAQTVDYIWQRSPNITAAGTVRARAATSQANLTASPGYDSTALSFRTGTNSSTWGYFDFHLDLRSAPKTYRWWRFDWADAANPLGYIDIARVYLSSALTIAPGIQVQGLGPTQSPVRLVSQGGDQYPVTRPIKNTIHFVIPFMSQAQALGGLFEIGQTRGTAKDIVVIWGNDIAAYLQHRTVYGLADEPYPLTMPTASLFDVNIKVTSL